MAENNEEDNSIIIEPSERVIDWGICADWSICVDWGAVAEIED